MSISHFRDSGAWQTSMQLAKSTCLPTASFPCEERHGLSSQLQPCAVSIPSNIAEGNAHASTRDYARFISMAFGSSAELQTQLPLSAKLKLGDDDNRATALDLCDRTGEMLVRLHQSLESLVRRLGSESRVPSPESRISEQAEEYV